MGTISNRFYVTCMEDGTTLHGNLRADKPLVQAYNATNNTCTPDWSKSANQPTVYLTLLNGSAYVAPDSGYTWKYNGTAIDFSTDTRFQKTTYTVNGVAMPAVKIVGNLASSSNVDVDTISFEGSYTISGQAISFVSEMAVRITQWTAGGYLGVIDFVGGVSDITAKGQTITMYGKLYSDSGEVTSGVTTRYYLNDSSTATAGASKKVDGTTYANAYQVTESQVTDYATVRCEFVYGGAVVYTAYVGIDDMQDPEYMYIQYNGNNGNAASLKTGQSVTYTMWVGTAEDASVNTAYTSWKVKLLDGDGNVITASLTSYDSSIKNVGSDNYRAMNVTSGKATITIPYALAYAYKKNITGLIYAATS